MKSYFHLFLFYIAVAQSLDPQTESLLTLKSLLTDNHNTLKDWSLPTTPPSDKLPCCSFSGIKCNQNSTTVISLNLSHSSFSGKLPPHIFNLTSLQTLDISQNNFSGNFPTGISSLTNLTLFNALSNSFTGELPTDLPQNLNILNLAGSYFTGSIPTSYGSLKKLNFLHLGGNLLSGYIPIELSNLQRLTHMEIGYNSYQGTIPWEFGYLTELKYLDIAGANLTGFIPKYFSNLTNLESLFLFSNHLSGEIPWEFGRVTSLVNLDLSDNNISGNIPESFIGLKKLKLLSLMFNEMSGSLPGVIAQLPALDTLFIWNNYFSGLLPRSLGMNSDLRWIDVSSNSFVGEIPEGICSRGFLYKVILFSNNFTGSLSSLSNCSRLDRIRVEDNSFSGVIPFKFSDLADIAYVDFSRNKLTGGIPGDIVNATKLEYFNISNNPELGGKLPLEIWSLPRLRNFSASSCGIFGRLPKFGSCKSITIVELSNNNISGGLKPSVSACRSLIKMDLSGNTNNFSGSAYRLGKLVSVLVIVTVLLSAGVFGLYYFRRSKWKMVSFAGLPHFKADDVLRSINSPETILPTGLTVVARRLDLLAKKKDIVLKVLTQMGNARHANLVRLLGYCYNDKLVYVLYDNNFRNGVEKKRDWESKKRIINGVAKGLYFLHHECYPAIPHGDVNSSNVLFSDDDIEPCLGEFGFKYVLHLNKSDSNHDDVIRAERKKDVYNFGELILEVLTNGKIKNGGVLIQNNPKDVLLQEVYASSSDSERGEVDRVVELALRCTTSNQSDRPCMEDALRLLPEPHNILK